MKLFNCLLVKVDDTQEQRTGATGIGGKEIILASEHHEVDYQKRAKTYGEVVETPAALRKEVLVSFEDPGSGGSPTYKAQNTKKIFMDSIEQDVQIGDIVHFHWVELSKKKNDDCEYYAEDGKPVFPISYNKVICAVRDGEIIPVGAHVLISPDTENWDEILVPTYDEEGNQRPKEQWIQTKTKPDAKYLQGYVRHVGNPLKGYERYVEVGDLVYFNTDCEFEMTIEGELYYAMRQQDLLAKIEE